MVFYIAHSNNSGRRDFADAEQPSGIATKTGFQWKPMKPLWICHCIFARALRRCSLGCGQPLLDIVHVLRIVATPIYCITEKFGSDLNLVV